MAIGDLSKYVRELGKVVESKAVADAAAEAMEREFTQTARRAMGGDLRMSGLGGVSTVIQADSSGGRAEVEIRNITLTDKGRRRRTRAKARGRGLATPFGPRASVKGSTTRGKHILDKTDDVFDAGITAAMSAIGRKVG